MRKRRPLDRKTKPVRDASLVVIASEDRYAVRQYFDFFESTRIQFRVLETQDGKSAPKHVLNRINEYIEEFEIGEGDTFWLVCDCDHWVEPNHIQNLTHVLQQCRQKDIQVALSNPCFDLWLLLHFADYPAEDVLTCDEVADRLRAAAGGYDKTKVYNLPIDDKKVLAAVKRAADKHPSLEEIPKRLQTAVHLIIRSLITKRIISVRSTADEAVGAGKKKPKGAKK
ncbi:MAG: RloB family protein [Gemmataceae bacterium]|nr:RloB family protein [Gemmataceae bacterium]